MNTIKTIFISLLIDLFSFTFILPIFPKIIQYYYELEIKNNSYLSTYLLFINYIKELLTGNENDLKLTITLIGGLLGSLYSTLQYIISPIIGKLSDKYGRRTVLIYSIIGNIISTLIWLFSYNFALFVLSRIVLGLTEANVTISTSIISDVTNNKERSKGMALVGIAFSIAFTLGPLISVLLLSKSSNTLFNNPYYIVPLISLILLSIELIFLILFLKETKTDSKNVKKIDNFKINFIHFSYLFIYSGMEFTLPFLAYEILNFNNLDQGKLLGYFGILSSIIQGAYIRRISNKVSEKVLIFRGFITSIIAYIIISLFIKSKNHTYYLYLSITLLAFTSATVITSLTSLASLNLSNDKGEVLGNFRSYGQLGRALGPIFSCIIYWLYGHRICYLLASILMIILLANFNFITKIKTN